MGGAVAIVHLRGNDLVLSPGDEASFGRATSCDLVVGALADGLVEDTGVSRNAGTIHFRVGATTVANNSTTRVFVVRPEIGPERTVGVGEALTLSCALFTIVLHGQVYRHTLGVEVRGAVVGDDRSAAAIADGSAPTTRVALSARERRYCTALCEPLLVQNSPRVAPATYRRAGERLGLQPASVRKQVDELRHRLIAQGFHGLDGEDGRDALMRFLVEAGSITSADLSLLG